MTELIIAQQKSLEPAGDGTPDAGPTPRRRLAQRLRKRMSWGLALSVAILVLAVLWAVIPGVFTSYDPMAGQTSEALQAPSFTHLFGTDQLGRDNYARLVYGSRLSLQSIVMAVAIALCVGSFFGLVAGFLGGAVDTTIMRVVDLLMSIPSLLLSLALITVLGPGTTNVALAVGLASVASFARLMRAEVMRVRTATYVEAASAVGARRSHILVRHVLPNSTGPVLAMAALELGGAVLAVSSLSFLGYGAQPPDPEWGSLISAGRDYMATAWWLTVLPGVVVTAIVLAANRIARAIEREEEH
ncbi:peptide ABC transporter permease [Mycobacterium sp. MS1601]|uniref:ABC transporter permease n=1 Tax=Mycobacterium sp. MS1601 TaxID=1936029 RepID=UPI0009794F3D|nr:peptide ABC transporter permease [Mycobacterium sp. MS1601]